MPKTTAKKKKPAAPTLATALTKRPDVKEKLELVNDSGRAVLVQEFSPFYVGAVPLIERGKAIKIKSVEDVSQMQEAREIRLELRQLRIAADKTRKRLKDESLRVGNAVQGMYNILMLDVEPMEKKLLDDEQHIERLEAERKRQLLTSALRCWLLTKSIQKCIGWTSCLTRRFRRSYRTARRSANKR